jgi:hypothetical protein
MIVAIVVTAGKEKSRFAIGHTSAIVYFPLFEIRIQILSWGRSGICLEHGWTDRRTEWQTHVAFVQKAFARPCIRGACHHIALPPDTTLPYRVGNVTRFQLLHVYRGVLLSP